MDSTPLPIGGGDLPYLISRYCNYSDLISISMISKEWYDRLNFFREKMLEKIPWSISFEYHLDDNDEPKIHYTKVMIGGSIESRCDDCRYCEKNTWNNVVYTHPYSGNLIKDIGFYNNNRSIITSSRMNGLILEGIGGSILKYIILSQRNHKKIFRKNISSVIIPFKIVSTETSYSKNKSKHKIFLIDLKGDYFYDDAIVEVGSFPYPDLNNILDYSFEQDISMKYKHYKKYICDDIDGEYYNIHFGNIFNKMQCELLCDIYPPSKRFRRF